MYQALALQILKVNILIIIYIYIYIYIYMNHTYILPSKYIVHIITISYGNSNINK